MSALKKLIALEKKSAMMGFNWPDVEAILEQAISECEEIRQSIKLNEGQTRLQEEVGDLLHAAVSLCIFAKLDVEQTVAQTTKKFEARLNALEKIMKERGYASLEGQPFDFMLDFWAEAKLVASTDL